MIIIHGSYRSRATRNIWLLEEIEIPWRLERVIQYYRPEAVENADGVIHTRSPQFLKRFSTGSIPVMQDGDFCLSESLAINLYLSKKYGGELRPKSSEDEAAWIQWALFGATSIEPPALAISTLSQSDSVADDKILAHERALYRPIKNLETVFAEHKWLTGTRFGVADINMAEIVRFASSRKNLFERFPLVKDWLARCQARPAFRRMWTLRNAEPA